MNIDKIWRSLNFYVDPSSSEMIELGTKKYPYRNFRSLASEILVQYSYQEVNISIYLKEGKTIYIEDDTTYFLSLGSITIKSYSNDSSYPGRALIIPTANSQNSINERAIFSLLIHTDLPIDEKISLKNYSDDVLGKLKIKEVSLKISESSFSLINVDVYREEIDYNSDKYFMFPVYLQNRDVIIGTFSTILF
jgi:hypothetical protein